jgi:hypothetical protein
MSSPITLDELISTMFQTIKDRKPPPKSVTFYAAVRPLNEKGTVEVLAAQVTVDGAQIYTGDVDGADAPMKVRFTVPIVQWM